MAVGASELHPQALLEAAVVDEARQAVRLGFQLQLGEVADARGVRRSRPRRRRAASRRRRRRGSTRGAQARAPAVIGRPVRSTLRTRLSVRAPAGDTAASERPTSVSTPSTAASDRLPSVNRRSTSRKPMPTVEPAISERTDGLRRAGAVRGLSTPTPLPRSSGGPGNPMRTTLPRSNPRRTTRCAGQTRRVLGRAPSGRESGAALLELYCKVWLVVAYATKSTDLQEVRPAFRLRGDGKPAPGLCNTLYPMRASVVPDLGAFAIGFDPRDRARLHELWDQALDLRSAGRRVRSSRSSSRPGSAGTACRRSRRAAGRERRSRRSSSPGSAGRRCSAPPTRSWRRR